MDAASAAPLGAVLRDWHALDVALLGDREDAVLLLDQILDVQLVLDLLDLGLPIVAVLVADLDQLVLQNALDQVEIGQDLAEPGDLFLQLLVLGLQLFALEALEGLQTHVQDRLGLDIVQLESFHQTLLGVVIGRTDDADDLVDVVLGDQQTL